jgi:long-chain acyl-CoA synthetase
MMVPKYEVRAMASLVQMIDDHGSRHGDRLACVVGPEQRSYGALADQILRLASAFRELGLEPGDRLGLYLPNCVEYVICFYAAMRAGLIATPINGAFTKAEVSYLLSDSGAAGIISTPALLERIGIGGEGAGGPGPRVVVSTGENTPPWCSLIDLLAASAGSLPYPSDDTPACLPYSSGTTGRSKGIIHTHDSMAMQAVLSANRLQLRHDDVLVHAMPLVHLYPGNILMGGLFVAGAAMVVQPAFDPPGFADLLSQHRATACGGVPTTYAMLTQLPGRQLAALDFGQLAVAFSAGAPLAGSIRSRFRNLFGADVLDCYGITEAAGNLVASMRYGDRPDLSCGVPYPLTDVRIVDLDDNDVPDGEVGELIARGPQIMTGYWNRPEATEQTLRGGYLRTGDLARRDQRGFYFIVDRKNDMILTGGYNVYPAEVEDVLQAHPDVAMCAVFGIPDEIKGEKPWAAVVLRTGAAVDEAALDAHCRAQLAAYKVPRRFVIVDELPRSSVGKILRRELRSRYTPVPTPSGDTPTPEESL